MGWVEIVIEVAREQAEALSDALMEAGALSVSVEDADEGTAAERPLFGEPGMEPDEAAWDRSRVVALAGKDADLATIVADATAAIGLGYALPFATREVEEQDWVRLTQSQFEPIHIGQRIWVVPSWHDAPQDSDALVLELDPGLAFGTGSHPTTRLCMEWLETHATQTRTLLDYGCGSGILALVAAKVGVPQVIGVDIDPQALEAANYNSARNQCEVAYFLPEEFARAHPEGERFDVVVANILAGPLQLMAPMLAGRVAPGGALVLSGVLDRQAQEVIAAYAPYIALTVWAEHEGWVALAGRLPE
ncbi:MULTISPECIES: 50S ribosomal protein L11 methyltransferase [unclassified Herbaspirillum]|uniref:50S ribosomal protein L11 methyltransferase n=1 Tax=unclassified Herbaspirillum TaxID=2624150 RepID=UPI0011519B05|nr:MULTISPECIES: 50S ribosomal protein L11 methyltransferase [unclassified Herbaspirillum]MBB5392633.1 ribosomal protein L11 methyltransferase [Herbaspirillum sp. SJZ102]TQK06270.1 [LSU ribosomal protein L11P]-lysine N-methyltransferase [Herbaspirillum sp. SJZ130]TQK12252.1 [LSU ribosomal protein L11P]-lysine N-methyltransferase [Herbaspirillum sp. SJZ106]TWC68473.1 [LSU ribosomal protein L11P]-lysine N-methyltransferase [Herbaspirillum sp. SJZ099]